MIVRDAILSDEPYTLASASSQSGMIRDVPRPIPVPRPISLPQTSVQMTPVAVATEVITAPTPEPILTLTAVAAWLSEQSHEVLCELPSVAAELEEIREDAHTAGFDAGRIEGRAAAAQEATRLHELLKNGVDAVRDACQRDQERLATQCIEIVVAAIEQIAGPLLATRAAVIGAVATALAKAKGTAELTVRVNPTQLALLETQREPLAAITGKQLQLVADSSVELGGCLIESQAGTLDARLEVQLQGLFETLRSAHAQAVLT